MTLQSLGRPIGDDVDPKFASLPSTEQSTPETNHPNTHTTHAHSDGAQFNHILNQETRAAAAATNGTPESTKNYGISTKSPDPDAHSSSGTTLVDQHSKAKIEVHMPEAGSETPNKTVGSAHAPVPKEDPLTAPAPQVYGAPYSERNPAPNVQRFREEEASTLR